MADPKMVTCAYPYQRKIAQTPKRSATRESFESTVVEHYARPIGRGRPVKYLKSEGHKFVRYADDFSIYTKSKAEARKIGNKVFFILETDWTCPSIVKKVASEDL